MTDQHDNVTGDLPTPGAGPLMQLLDVALIEESLTNPRKHFDPARLRELADSIAATGVHQPILVRPLPGSRVAETWGFRRQGAPLPAYELVAGARRLRACKLAKVKEVPAMIREMTDQQALEAQVVENLQRQDVTALEEAEGFDALLRQGGMTAEDIAAKVGKSRSHIYARLKVLDLCPAGREALREGKGGLDFSKALLIARIPDEQLQIKALDALTKTNYLGEPDMSYRQAQQHIQQHYMLQLERARFNITDASLVADAGSCKDCSKRTGANPDLFSDVKSADVCTDPKCYRRKEDAHTATVVQQAKDKGQTVIIGKEAEELATQGYNGKVKGYRRLDSAEDSPTDQPLRKIIGAQMKAEGIKPTMIENPRKKGELIEALPNDVVLRLLKMVESQAHAAKKVAKEAIEFANDKKAKAEAKAKAKFEQGWRDAIIDRTWAKLTDPKFAQPVFNLDVHRYLALRAVKSLGTSDMEKVCDVIGLGKVGGHSALAEFAKETASPDFLQLLCIMQQDSSANDHSYGGRIVNEGLFLVARAVFKDEADAMIEAVKLEAAALYLPPITPAKPENAAAPESTSTPGLAAQAVDSARAKPSHGRGRKGPAAQAGAYAQAQPKVSAEEAAHGIAAALQGLEAEPVADAQAQGDEAHASRDAQAHDHAPQAQGIDPAPVAKAQGQDRGSNEADAGVSDGAAVKGGLKAGAIARVNDKARAPSAKPYVGLVGTLAERCGPEAWYMTFAGKEAPCSFHASELDQVEPPSGLSWHSGRRVRVTTNKDLVQLAQLKRCGTEGEVRGIEDDKIIVQFKGRSAGQARFSAEALEGVAS